MSVSYSKFSIRGNPPTGRDEDIVARKLCWKDQMVCARSFGCMGFAPGMLECRKYNHKKVEASQTDLSIAFT
jgi:hypothetical protein